MQTSFSELEYATKKKLTRRDRFLAELEAITPWAALEQAGVFHHHIRPSVALTPPHATTDLAPFD